MTWQAKIRKLVLNFEVQLKSHLFDSTDPNSILNFILAFQVVQEKNESYKVLQCDFPFFDKATSIKRHGFTRMSVQSKQKRILNLQATTKM